MWPKGKGTTVGGDSNDTYVYANSDLGAEPPIPANGTVTAFGTDEGGYPMLFSRMTASRDQNACAGGNVTLHWTATS